MAKRIHAQTLPPYVVYVTYPNDSKEYDYACDLPGIHAGSVVAINGARCTVRSVEHRDPGNLKWIPGSHAVRRYDRTVEITKRLGELERHESNLARWAKLTSPEARRLVKELKELSK